MLLCRNKVFSQLLQTKEVCFQYMQRENYGDVRLLVNLVVLYHSGALHIIGLAKLLGR